MAGHSKWANINHRKERSDKKKGKIFSRLAKEIISDVRQGGIDPKSNTKLKIALQKAKEEISIFHRAMNEFLVKLIDFAILDIKALTKSFFVNFE